MPYRPDVRQYRSFAASNFKPFTRDDSDESESYVTKGYFTTFSEPYELFDDYYEEIDPHALDETDMSDVLFQVNHEGHVYARTRNMSLRLGTDFHGGYCEADLSGSKQGREELYESIKNGLVDRMSFGFTIADDGFEYTVDSDGVYHTRITKISKLFDVSAIEGFPANEGTEISARSLRDAAIEAQREKERIERESQAEPETPEQEPEVIVEDEPIVIDASTITAGTITFPDDAITSEPADTDGTIDFEQAMEEQRRSLRKRRARALQLIN